MKSLLTPSLLIRNNPRKSFTQIEFDSTRVVSLLFITLLLTWNSIDLKANELNPQQKSVETQSEAVPAESTQSEALSDSIQTENTDGTESTQSTETTDSTNLTEQVIQSNSVSANIEQTESTAPNDELAEIPGVNPSEQNKINRSLKENPWIFLHAYVATYQISADGDALGNATRKMEKKDNQWQLEVSSKLSKWLLTLRSREYSKFKIKERKMFTDEFYSKTKVSFRKDRLTKQAFDWDAKQEVGTRGKRKWSLPLESQVFDRANHLLKLRSDLLIGNQEFKYLVSYKGLREFYEYQLKGEDVIKTPFGEYQTIRLERVSGDDSSFSVWLSPELNYFPVKIAQFEQDKPDVTLTLTNLEFTAPDNSLKVSKKE
ncbi:DUF3108 domain-containing protein [Aliikangiella marina]|uniref:DUF3108 domain-containing protein n=1 Tax=Aliikangiella marina TaxID=1712262 RepID=A0A545TI14_9GAMM|nr:DUF3108 domain-containing protein [Aliikangiella marina]TQV76863.1 DUF3108 domain-containing protein [Aliikangiella marina]